MNLLKMNAIKINESLESELNIEDEHITTSVNSSLREHAF
jgi:hypothetical protein